MKAANIWKTIATGVVACAVGAGLAYAKLPQAPMDDAAKAKAARVAFLTSRTNTMLSIPMLFFMVAGPHGLPRFW